MTDANNATEVDTNPTQAAEVSPVQQEQEQAKAPTPMMSQTELEAVKKALFATLDKAYQSFVASVANLPTQSISKANSMLFFDTGFLWLKNGIAALNLPTQGEAANPVSIPDNAPPTA